LTLHFFELCLIILSQGSHPPVPKQKIQAVIALEILVVLVVANGSVDPSSYPGFMKILWVKLPAKMSVNIVDDHEKEKDQYMKFMDGNGKKENNHDASLNDSFQRVEGIGSPGGWIGRLVVHQVKEFEQVFMVHQAVHPVKIGVVHEKHDGEGCPEIEHAVFINIFVKIGIL
jgi:hypothetical protein